MADYSTTLTTTPVMVVPAATEPRTYLSIMNVGGTGSVWASHTHSNVAPNAIGCYEVEYGTTAAVTWSSPSPDYNRTFVPQGPVWMVSAQPHTGNVTNPTSVVTVEAI